MYADPTRKLYDALGAVVRLAGPEQRPDYVRDGAVVGALRAIWVRLPLAISSPVLTGGTQRGPLSHLTQLGKQGNISQLGGDFVLGPGACAAPFRLWLTRDGAGPTSSFAWRMRNTQDRASRALRTRAGLGADRLGRYPRCGAPEARGRRARRVICAYREAFTFHGLYLCRVITDLAIYFLGPNIFCG